MAQLFDRARFLSPYARDFNPSTQLPMISDLGPEQRQRMGVAELGELSALFPSLMEVADKVQASADADPFSDADFHQKIWDFHLAVLEMLAAVPEQLGAYHLGIALSDLCWKPNLSDPEWGKTFLHGFEQGEITELQVLLRTASNVLPNLAAVTVSKSLEKWQDWADVTAVRFGAGESKYASSVVRTLRIQGDIWHQLLTVETLGENEDGLSLTTVGALRRLRPLLIVAVLAAVVLYLTITHFSGLAKTWTAIGTIATALGITGASLLSAARKAVSAYGWNQQATAKAEARVWSVTMLPAIPLSAVERSRLNHRDIRLRPVRMNLDNPSR